MNENLENARKCAHDAESGDTDAQSQLLWAAVYALLGIGEELERIAGAVKILEREVPIIRGRL